MKRSELTKLSRRELYEMAKAYALPGRSRMTKAELVDDLSRVSTRRAMPTPKPPKRRMAKRRVRRRAAEKRRAAAAQTAPEAAATSSSRPVPQPQEPPKVYVDRGPELPQEYGQDKVVAMVRDPNWIYVYWDLSGGARQRLGGVGGTWVLRVRDMSTEEYSDIPILIEGGNWYLPVSSDTEYRVDIGVMDAQGRFHLAASSRPVKTPRMGISESIDDEWLILEEEFRRLVDMTEGVSHRLSGSRFISEVISGRQRARELRGMHSMGISSISGSRRR